MTELQARKKVAQLERRTGEQSAVFESVVKPGVFAAAMFCEMVRDDLGIWRLRSAPGSAGYRLVNELPHGGYAMLPSPFRGSR